MVSTIPIFLRNKDISGVSYFRNVITHYGICEDIYQVTGLFEARFIRRERIYCRFYKGEWIYEREPLFGVWYG